MLASTTNPLAMRLYEKSSETIIPEEEEMHERDLQADKEFADNYKNIVSFNYILFKNYLLTKMINLNKRR